jgi:hypothetical protein
VCSEKNPDPQPSTCNSICSHPPWMVKAVCYSPLATRHSLSFHQSLFASRHSPFTIRHSLLAFVSARQEPRPPNSVPLPSRVPRLLSRSKSALNFCVINYGLKSVAWFAFALPSAIHATGFSQWLMTKFLSVEFIRHLGGRTSR